MPRLFRSTALVLLLLCAGLVAQDSRATESGPSTVQVGAYLLRLGAVSQKDGSFAVDFWIWFRWQDRNIKPYESFEIANGKIDTRSNAEVVEDQGYLYTSVRVQGTVFHQFDVRRFPLDDHRLTIELEDENMDVSRLVYAVDDGVAMDPGVQVGGWAVTMGPAAVSSHVYPTTYGLRSSGANASTYSRFVLQVGLSRTGLGPLIKQFWISFLAVLLGLLALRVKATDLDARFGLGVGSIFAASANAYTISENLPATTVVTLAEQINFLAIGTIFLTVFISIGSLRLCYSNRESLAARQDDRALWGIGVLYLIANVWILGRHVY